MKDPDKDGRYPMSGREYLALRTLYAGLNSLLLNKDELRSRCELTEGTWQKLEDSSADLLDVLDKVLSTIPYLKLKMFKRELPHLKMQIIVDRTSRTSTDSGFYIDNDLFLKILNLAVKDNCFFCQRNFKDGTRHCELYKAIQDCYPYQFEEDELCPFCGTMEIKEYESYHVKGDGLE